MSDTPRTDAKASHCNEFNIYDGDAVVPAYFARQLERENATLRADKERMDWCDKNLSGLTLLGTSMREYVDAARKEQP